MIVTDLRSQLESGQARYAALLAASLDAIVIMDHEGRFLEFNRAAEAMFGYRREQVIGRVIADFIIPERLRERHTAGMARYLAEGTGPVVNQRIELPAMRANGEEFPVEIAIVPAEGAGSPVFVGFIRDITELKNAERRQQLVMAESAHRIRNILAVVQSIAVSTLRGERPIAEARQVISRRIGALSRSHATLIEGGMRSASLVNIIAQEIEGFSDRIDAAGPDVTLNPEATQTMALVVHELATNAAKHGALSAAGGRVTVRWSMPEAADGQRFRFEWREQGGPPVTAPSRTGFGRAVLEEMATSGFRSTPVLEFGAAGFGYSFETSLAALTKEE